MSANGERRSEGRWRGRPVLSATLRLIAFLVPVVAAIGATTLVRYVLPSPVGMLQAAGWLAALLVISVSAVIVFERLARRLLPIATLYKLTMLFPDRAPNRFAMARRAGNVQELHKRINRSREAGVEDAAAMAAENILMLSATLSSHDRRTRGHSERVRVFADMLASELKLSQDDRDRIRWAALLHDIGKLKIAPEILNKKGKPDSDEWARIRAHPVAGAELAKPLLPWLGAWAGAIEHHHEKWDGSGYPHGLKTEKISMGGRIVAVADCFETMTAARPYKKPMTVEAAREELSSCAGTHFDPACVRAFLNIALGKLRRTVGPVAWLTQLPFMGDVSRVAHQGSTAIGRLGNIATSAVRTIAVAAPIVAGSALSTTSAAKPAPRHQVRPPTAPVAVDKISDAVTPAPSPSPSQAPASTPRKPDRTPAPTPAPTPAKKVTPPPVTPAPAAPSAETYYLASHGTETTILPLRDDPPVATSLGNYDANRNTSPGLTLGASDSDPWTNGWNGVQVWTRKQSRPTKMSGPTTLEIYSALQNFKRGAGSLEALLWDCGSNIRECKPFARAALSLPDWSGGSSTWVKRTLDFGVVRHELGSGRFLVLSVMVRKPTTDNAMWLAFDTAAYPSALRVTTG